MFDEIIKEIASKQVTANTSREYEVTFWSPRLGGYVTVYHKQNPSGGYLTASLAQNKKVLHLDGVDWYDSLTDSKHLEDLILSNLPEVAS